MPETMTNQPRVNNPGIAGPGMSPAGGGGSGGGGGAAGAAGAGGMLAGMEMDPLGGPRQGPQVRPLRKPGELKSGWYWGTGRRKTAVARVRLRPASGEGKVRVQITAEKFKTIEEYFAEDRDRNNCYAPLKATNTLGKLEIVIRLSGGGYMGQAGAVLLGVSRALREYDPTLEDALREHGMLTRDSRDVERKKYGQAGARRRFQFSKR